MSMEEFRLWQQKINQEVLRAEKAANQITKSMDQQAQQLNSTVVQSVTQAVAQQAQPDPHPAAELKIPVD
jgi:hypothetical protein